MMRDSSTWTRTWRWGSRDGLGYYLVGCGLRVYVTALAAAGSYSLLWVFELADSLTAYTLAAIWLAVVGLGLALLFVALLVFYTSPG